MAYVNDVTAVLSRKREGGVDSFADIWKQSCALASLSDTELVQPRLTGGRQRNRANVPAASPEQYYRYIVFIPFMDHVLGDLQERFADHNRAVIACRRSFLHSSTSMHSMLCYRRWKCIRRSSTTVTTSSEPSLSCGSNAGMLQRNHPRLHWMHNTACNASLYPNLSILLQVLVTLPVTTATAERSFSTLKRLKTSAGARTSGQGGPG